MRMYYVLGKLLRQRGKNTVVNRNHMAPTFMDL